VSPTNDANNNGLIDTKEGATAGTINYASNYGSFAVDAALNGCLDSDSDGVGDVNDLDDDNDGILDLDESQDCGSNVLITPVSATSSPVYGGNTANSTIDGSGFFGSGLSATVTAPSTLSDAWLLKEPLTSGFIEYTLAARANLGGVVLWAPDAFNYGGGDAPPKDFTVDITFNNGQVFTTGVYTTAQPNGSGSQPGAQVFNFPRTFKNVTKLKLNFLNGWYDISNNSLNQVSTAGRTVDAAYNMFLGEFRALCGPIDMDTDGDGVPNRLDLDSDGDGCADALEAGISTALLTSGQAVNLVGATITSGTTTSTIQNAVITTVTSASATFGPNGFADAVETASESGLYNGTYNYSFATSKNYAACADLDGDNIPDVSDIDDDNDGVLDAIESPNCFFTASEWLFGARNDVEVTTGLAMSATYKSLNKLVDGDNGTGGGSYAVNFNASTTAARTVYAFKMPTPVELKTIYIGYVNANTHFNTGTIIELQGSNDNAAWTNLGSGYAAVTSVPGVAGTINANTFSVTSNSGKYLYYRIYWVSGGGVNANGYANEVYFETLPTYQPSANPKSACTNDTDADGKLNHQDLDSDGDGCSDAIEAGSSTAATSTTVYPTGTDGNTNGLLNDYEGTTVGTVNYTSTYTSYAITNTINGCTDSDGDGVKDVNDIDDDNDGVLDAIESPGCFFQANEWNSSNKSLFATVSSDLNLAAPNTNLAALVNGIGSTAAVEFIATPAQSQLNKALLKIELSHPTQLDAIYIQKTSATQIFTGTSSVKVQGSLNNIDWTDLTAAITPINVVK
jgi:hypothetical protein